MNPELPARRFHFNPATLLELLRMSLPMVISQGAFAVMIFTDRFFLAQISPAHMAAALGGGVAWYFSISLFNGVIAYANALVAQYLGARQYDKCARVVTQGLLMSLLCVPILMLLAWLVGGIFAGMGHAEEQVALEKSYFMILMLGSVFTLMKVALASFFSGTGRTRVVMTCDVLGVFVNIPLSYALVFGKAGLPALGISGAAIGTVISTVFSLVLFLAVYLQKSNRIRFMIRQSLHFDPGIMRRYIRLGLPSGLEMFLNIAAFNLFLLMFQSYGITEAASAAIVFNWDILSFVPMMGLSIAVMSLIGRYVGAGDMTKTHEVTTSGYILGLAYSSMLALIFIVFRTEFVELFIFSEDRAGDIRILASFMMAGLATYVLAEGVLQVASGVLRGAGDTRWIMIASVSLHWAMLVAQYFIIKVFAIDPRVSWLVFVLMILMIAITFIVRLKGSRWRSPERLRRILAEDII
ncbi:MAG: MATE family efflux transporter [Pseudomonadales bacterium]|nr:MATE family efflux transporter [Pseudomonadales bacterium]